MLGKNCPLSDKYRLWATLHQECFITIMRESPYEGIKVDCSGCHIHEERQKKLADQITAMMNTNLNIPYRGSQFTPLTLQAQASPHWINSSASMPSHTHSFNFNPPLLATSNPMWIPVETADPEPKPSLWKRLWKWIKI